MHLRQIIKGVIRPFAQSLIVPLVERIAPERMPTDDMGSKWACQKGWRPPSLPTEDYISAVFGYDDEPEIKKMASLVRHRTMLSFERLATLCLQVRYLDAYQLPGALVECGVWRGGAAAMMVLAHLRSGSVPWRHIHLFDSWQGLPEPDEEHDGKFAVDFSGGGKGGALKPIGQCVAGLDETRTLLEEEIGYPAELIHYHVGWFQETLPRTDVGEIALLRLDGDWYESTRVCLEHLYSKVVKNGVVVLDDYGYWAGCRKATDEFIDQQSQPIMLHHIDSTGRYFIKCSREEPPED